MYDDVDNVDDDINDADADADAYRIHRLASLHVCHFDL
jgi:hypothetical protein